MPRLKAAIVVAVFLVAVMVASSASAATLYVKGSAASRGVGYARLNMADNTAAKRIGIALSVYRPNPYLNRYYSGSQTYEWRFGTKMSNGYYPVRMWARNDTYDRVNQFTIYSSAHKTASGVGVYSSATYLKSKYPEVRVATRTSTNTIYRIEYGTGRPYTDFNVRNSTGKIWKIDIYK